MDYLQELQKLNDSLIRLQLRIEKHISKMICGHDATNEEKAKLLPVMRLQSISEFPPDILTAYRNCAIFGVTIIVMERGFTSAQRICTFP